MPQVCELTPADARELRDLYDDYEWFADREVEAIRRALANTEIALGLADDGELVAAARVLTDYVYYAKVYDVVVAADRRGAGLGRELVTAVRDHPDLADCRGLSLLCRDGLVPFYETVGFERFDPEMGVPEGGTEELVRMTLEFEEDDGIGAGESDSTERD